MRGDNLAIISAIKDITFAELLIPESDSLTTTHSFQYSLILETEIEIGDIVF